MRMTAKVPQSPQRAHFTKHHFTIDLNNNVVTCPAGQTTSTFQKITARFGKNQEKRTTKRYNSRRRTLWQVALAAAVVNLMVIAGQKLAGLFLFLRWIVYLNAIPAVSPWQRLTPLVAAYLLNRRSVKIYRF